MENNQRSENQQGATRRRFLQTTAAGAAAVSVGVPLRGANAVRKFKVGLIGCGGRGTGAARDAMNAAKMDGREMEIYAVADLFEDKVERPRRQYKIPKERAFHGFDAFHKLLDLDEIDYVILATPPHFRPEHFEAAIAHGKNVFTEKPVGVDAPGIRRFAEAGKKAKEKGLSVAAGTQRRHSSLYQEAKRRVEDGAIGDIVAGRCYWNQGGLWTRAKEKSWSDTEWQVRNWLYFTWLSGDHIVEQHVHNIDITNWMMGRLPKAARGMGGRQVRKGKDVYGNVFDHFATELIYDSPNKGYPDIRIISQARQIKGCWNEVSEHYVGTEGSISTNQPKCEIHGKNHWIGTNKGTVNPYVQEHRDLQKSIVDGKGELNETWNVATSTFTAILAREACYTGAYIKWDDLWNSDKKIGPAKYEFGDMPIPPVAQVGKPM